MIIGKFIEYKGCIGTIEVDSHGSYCGRLTKYPKVHSKTISGTMVIYSGSDLIDLFEQYKMAIDEYYDMLTEINVR